MFADVWFKNRILYSHKACQLSPQSNILLSSITQPSHLILDTGNEIALNGYKVNGGEVISQQKAADVDECAARCHNKYVI